MDRETAIRKLRACLRLAKSSSPNEAATAIRQAQALMREHGLDEADANVDDIRRSEGRTRSRGGRPPQHVHMLASTIACAFRCYLVTVRGDVTCYSFTGRNADPEIASYAFEVLRRQMEAAATKHTRRVRKPVVKRARAEAFGRGWVIAVRDMLPVEDLPAPDAEAFKAHFEAHMGKTERAEIAPRSGGKERDALAGLLAGRKAQLHTGMNGTHQAAIGQERAP